MAATLENMSALIQSNQKHDYLSKVNGAQKVVYYGIETDKEITWKSWEPGQKYTKKLILKNINFFTQKINFKVPNQDVFVTTYPKTITLSAGTSFCLPITFRPDRKIVFEDEIQFQTNQGELFTIPIKGLLPQFNIQIPDKISCGLSATHDVTQTIFELKNLSELSTPYRWSFEQPFTIEPAEGELKPYGTQEVTITVRPPDSQTFTLGAICSYGVNYQHQKTIELENVSKYPQVVVNVEGKALNHVLGPEGHILLDFGQATLMETSQKMIMIQNPSSVGSNITIERSDALNTHDRMFHCPIETCLVPAKSCMNILIDYTPMIPFTKSVEYFKINVSNLCGDMYLKCQGYSDGPKAILSTTSINFNILDLGESTRQPLEVINKSPDPITFQFITDPNSSVFHFSKIGGFIDGHGKCQIVVTFRPQHPIQYYRRVACLIIDHEPLFLDLLGTCHDLYLRPHHLDMHHVRNFAVMMERGLSYFPPEQLRQFLKNDKLSLDEKGYLMMKEAEALEQFCDPIDHLPPIKEYFFSNNDSDIVFSVPHLSVDRHYIDFTQDRESSNNQETIFVKNSTKGTLLLFWNDASGKYYDNVFSITPEKSEIGPGRSMPFVITFKPTNPNRIFGIEMEAFAVYKSQREFQISDSATVSPPFCLTVRCIGTSFEKTSEAFLPKFDLDRYQVVFPAVNPKEDSFRYIALANTAEYPMLYKIDAMKEPFSIKPKLGVLEPGAHQIFTLRCEPQTIKQFVDCLRFSLNDRLDIRPTVPLLGSADNPEIQMENDSDLYFMPTNIGNLSKRVYTIKNVSRMPIQYEWKIRHEDGAIITVEPRSSGISGMLQPNECHTQTWTFTPTEAGKRLLKPVLLVRGRSPSGVLSKPKTYPLRVVAMGVEGNLRCEEDHLDYGTVVVGTSVSKVITLYNDSECSLYYRLVVRQTTEGTYPDPELGRDPQGLELSITEGCLPGRCKQKIRATARAYRRVYYQHQILYYLTNNPDDLQDLRCLNAEPRHLCHILCRGGFPTLRITDAQGTGSARYLSKRQMWTYLSLDNFNVCLDSDPSVSELVYNVATRQSFNRTPPVYTRAILDINLGAAPLGADISTVQLLFENPDQIPCEFHLLLPEDLQLELEYWAETGEYTEEELHQMKVQDNRLFEISPRKANLEGGQSTVVVITYKHSIAGTDRLPVLMKIDQGREILLNLVGVTVAPERRYIHFHSRKHVFAPTAIGQVKCPVQLYEMYNGGCLPLHFTLDTSALENLKEENHGVPIMECLTPEGHILPGRSAQVQWSFTPLEAKTYQVEIPIRVTDGDTAVITFMGIGYDQRQLGNTMPLTANPPPSLPNIDGPAQPGQAGVPSLQSIPLPNQLVYLSQERVSLGNLPLFCRSRRVVFLNNDSMDREASFAWFVTSVENAEIINVSPQSGKLAPKESALCHITFVAKGNPQFFDIELICEVTDETKMKEYKQEIANWREELRRQREEFTITENNLDADIKAAKHLSGKTTPLLKTPGASGAQTPAVRSTESNSAKYKTLPPITTKGNQKSEGSSSSKTTPKRRWSGKPSDFMKEPVKPKPFMLHLGVTGRTYSISEYQVNFPEQYQKQFIDRTLLAINPEEQADASSKVFPAPTVVEPRLCTDEEAHVLETTLSSLVRSLLDDSDFLEAVKQLPNEPVPLYRQLPESKETRVIISQADEVQIASESPQQLEQNKSVSQSQASASKRSDVSNGNLVNSVEEIPGKPVEELLSLKPGEHAASLFECSARSIAGSSSEHVSEGDTEINLVVEEQVAQHEKERILQSSGFGVLVEGIMENMLTNIIAEANSREFDLTVRPRLIALPPRSRQRMTSHSSSKIK